MNIYDGIYDGIYVFGFIWRFPEMEVPPNPF